MLDLRRRVANKRRDPDAGIWAEIDHNVASDQGLRDRATIGDLHGYRAATFGVLHAIDLASVASRGWIRNPR